MDERPDERPALSLISPNLQRARDQASLDDQLRAFKAESALKENVLKANFRSQLESILRDVGDDEEAHQELRRKFEEINTRHNDVSAQAAQLKAENASLLAQLESAQHHNDALLEALQAAEVQARENKQVAEAAKDIMHKQVQLREEDGKRVQLELESLHEQHRSTLHQVQQLMELLAARDDKVAALGGEANSATAALKEARTDMARLEAVARATGERAAAAEAALSARSNAAVLLHSELSKLRERYLAELSELKMMRVAAGEAARHKEQLVGAQAVSAALLEARDELRSAVGLLTSRLAGAEERAHRLTAASSIRDTVLQAIAGIALDGDASDAIDSLSAELDLALNESAASCGRAAELAAGLSQQESHVRRLMQEAADVKAKQRESEEHTTQLQRMVAELQAEMQRLASQAAIGAPIILDMGNGMFRPALAQDLQHTTATGTKVALPTDSPLVPATSQMETACTAMRVAIADRGYGLRALSSSLATAPGLPLDALRGQQRAVQGLSSDLSDILEKLSVRLSVRPLDAPACLEELRGASEQTAHTSGKLVQIRDALAQVQVEVVGLEDRAAAAEGAVKQAGVLLGSWSSAIARMMGEGQAVDEPTRLQLRVELKSAEDVLHKAASQLSGTAVAGTLAAGDAAFAEAEVQAREATNALMELSARLPDRELLSDAKLKVALLSTEAALRERQRALATFKARLTGVPGDCASLAATLGGVIADLGVLQGSGQELARVLDGFISAGRDAPVDVVAMQGELLALRAQLREKEGLLQEMEAAGNCGGALRPTRDGGAVRQLVPLEALQASERAREGLEAELSKVHATQVQQRLRHSTVRFAFVDYFSRMRGETLLANSFAAWRSVVKETKVERAEEAMAAVTTEKQRLEGLAKERRAVTANVILRMLADSDEVLARSTLLSWRLAATRKMKARHQWGLLTAGLQQAAARYRGALPQFTVAQRMASRTLATQDPFAPPPAPPTLERVAAVAFLAWRMWARMKRRSRQVGTLSAGLPAWVAAVGDRRRLERAWLGWRLSVVEELVGCANEMLQRAGQQAVGRHSRSTGGWSLPGGPGPGLPPGFDGVPAPAPQPPSAPGELFIQASVPRAASGQAPMRMAAQSAPGAFMHGPPGQQLPAPPPHQHLPSMTQFGIGADMGEVGLSAPTSQSVQYAPSPRQPTLYPLQPQYMAQHSPVSVQEVGVQAPSQGGAPPPSYQSRSVGPSTGGAPVQAAISYPQPQPALGPFSFMQAPPMAETPHHMPNFTQLAPQAMQAPEVHDQQAVFLPYTNAVLGTDQVPPNSAAAVHMAMHAAAIASGAQQQSISGGGAVHVPVSAPSSRRASAAGVATAGGAQQHAGSSQPYTQQRSQAGAARATAGSASIAAAPVSKGAGGSSRSKSTPRGVGMTKSGLILVERTRELYQAVDALAQGIHNTTDALSPRRKVLQQGPHSTHTHRRTTDASEASGTFGTASFPVSRRTTVDSQGVAAPELSSPTRVTAGDSVLLKFQRQAQRGSETARTRRTELASMAGRDGSTGAGAAASTSHQRGTGPLPRRKTQLPVPTVRSQATSTAGALINSAFNAPAPTPEAAAAAAQAPVREPSGMDVSFAGDQGRDQGGRLSSYAGAQPSIGYPQEPSAGVLEVTFSQGAAASVQPSETEGGGGVMPTSGAFQLQQQGASAAAAAAERGAAAGPDSSRIVLSPEVERSRRATAEHAAIQAPSVGTSRVVPTAEGVLHAAATKLAADTPQATTKPGGKKYAHVPSRLHQETIATLAKRRAGNLPGGTPNLTALPPAPYQPIMAPLTTYVPPSRSTPGPMQGVALSAVTGAVTGATAAGRKLEERLGRQGVYHAFDKVYGPSTATVSQLSTTGAPSIALSGATAAAAAALAAIPGSGNLSVQQIPDDVPRIVRFERRHGPGLGEAGGDVPPVPVTVVRLPEPVRVNISELR